MAGKISKTKKQSKTVDAEQMVSRRQKVAQVIMAIFAIIIILSMVFSAVVTY